jgi:threonine/homoserine/homoserine lactone efflux protein
MLFLTVALVHIVALMSPGPDFFFVSQTAVSRSRKEAMMGVLGITMGVMVWAAVALLGLNLILAKMAWLHNIIMVGGGLYLCWMGYQMLRGALKKKRKTGRAKGGAGNGRPQLCKRAADQPGEPESDYLFRLRVLAVCGR